MDQRVKLAIESMSMIGIAPQVTRSMLKRLLETYDSNWEYIEAENYRLLADSIFQSQVEEAKMEKDDVNNEKNTLGSRTSSLKKTEKECVPSRLSNASDQDSIADSRKRSGKELVPACYKLKSGQGMSSRDVQVVSSSRGEENLLPQYLCSRTSSLKKTEKECVPSRLSNASDQDSIADNRKRPGKEPVPACYKFTSGQGMSSRDIQVISSSRGEVNLLLQCSSDLLKKKNFRMPSVDSICKFVEDQFLLSAKKLDPKLSFMNLLKHMCDYVSETGSQLAKRNTAQKNIIPSNNIADNNGHDRSKKKMGSVASVIPAGDIKRIVNPRDITNGQERFKIPLVSDDDINYDLPSFHYIRNNVVYQNASVPISLARIGDEYCCSDCYGDCLRASVPCPCARESGGEYAYTSDGLLSEKFLDSYIDKYRNTKDIHLHYCQNCPLERIKNEEMPEKCKGHLISTFIKECWTKCGCHTQCGNRVVQRGVRCKLEVFCSGKAKGWGLRSTEELRKGTFICEYIGEILTNLELYDRTMSVSRNEKHTYPVMLDADWASEGLLEDEDALCLDATRYGNVARFMNHRCCDANTIEIPVEIEMPDHHYYHVAFFTTRKVEAKEELCWDYGIDFSDKNHPIKAFKCSCGSMLCRNKPLIKGRAVSKKQR